MSNLSTTCVLLALLLPAPWVVTTVEERPAFRRSRLEVRGESPQTVHLVEIPKAALGPGRFRVVPASPAGDRPSDLAAASRATVVVNGGYFAAESSSPALYTPLGLAGPARGRARQARDGWPAIATLADGGVRIAGSLADARRLPGVVDILQSKPRIVTGGRVSARTANPDVTALRAQARTLLATRADGGLILVVAEAFHAQATGLTLVDAARLLVALGAREGLNLDGGGSSALAVDGRLVSRPSGGLHPPTLPGVERPVANVLGFFEDEKPPRSRSGVRGGF